MKSPYCEVTDLHYTPAGTTEAATGLLGFVRFTYGGTLVLDSVAVRQTLTGRLALAFPTKRDRAGQLHAYVRPRNTAARVAIESAVFTALGQVVESTS
jgi:DNA-binding cell septation regulator SpoVG